MKTAPTSVTQVATRTPPTSHSQIRGRDSRAAASLYWG